MNITVTLTPEQLALLEELVQKKFDEVAQAWLPVEETKDMNRLSYDTMMALRTVRESARYDGDEALHFAATKKEYLQDNCLCSMRDLAQQGLI
jgi:hypothetical protein|tara:strand:- start:3463 stop:3741 length:279 start_codon:yes stop_codon:yes gene_type:complete